MVQAEHAVWDVVNLIFEHDCVRLLYVVLYNVSLAIVVFPYCDPLKRITYCVRLTFLRPVEHPAWVAIGANVCEFFGLVSSRLHTRLELRPWHDRSFQPVAHIVYVTHSHIEEQRAGVHYLDNRTVFYGTPTSLEDTALTENSINQCRSCASTHLVGVKHVLHKTVDCGCCFLTVRVSRVRRHNRVGSE